MGHDDGHETCGEVKSSPSGISCDGAGSIGSNKRAPERNGILAPNSDNERPGWSLSSRRGGNRGCKNDQYPPLATTGDQGNRIRMDSHRGKGKRTAGDFTFRIALTLGFRGWRPLPKSGQEENARGKTDERRDPPQRAEVDSAGRGGIVSG